MKIFGLTLFCLRISYQSTAQNTSPQLIKNIFFHPIENDNYRNIIQPTTFSNSTKVYSQPDTNSVVLLDFKFKTHLRLLGEWDDTKEIRTEKVKENGERVTFTQFTNLRWYKVELNEGNGYIKSSNVSTHTFTDNKGLFDYFFITKESCYLFKYDNVNKQFIDSIELKSFRCDIVQSVNSNGWQNVNMLFRTTMINAYCGGGTTNIFIVDANGKLSELITTKSYADDGSADTYGSNVWLPIKFENEKILLIANGDIDNVFDRYSGQLNTFPFPKEMTIPKIKLVIFKEIQEKSLYDHNNEPILNKDGSYKSKTIKNVTKYLRWNGKELVPIK
ncbi:MAG: SH3 domain-containing protein [Nitrososphaeraceae archaeon]